MFHLRLIKALSYCGVVKATRANPDVYVEEKATAEKAVATGYFKLLTVTEESIHLSDENEQQGEICGGKKLEDMNVSELETFAAYKNISIKGISKKTDIISKLRKELGDEDTSNEVDYGSPTMQDLQEH